MNEDQLFQLLGLCSRWTRLSKKNESVDQVEREITILLEQSGKTKDQLPQLLQQAFELVITDYYH